MIDTAATLKDFTDEEIRDEYAERYTVAEQLASFSNTEIESEYEDRFDTSDSVKDFDSDTLIEELDRRGDLPEPEIDFPTDEVIDLIAEAARTSRHARKAFDILREERPGIRPLDTHQRLIAGRMTEVAA